MADSRLRNFPCNCETYGYANFNPAAYSNAERYPRHRGLAPLHVLARLHSDDLGGHE